MVLHLLTLLDEQVRGDPQHLQALLDVGTLLSILILFGRFAGRLHLVGSLLELGRHVEIHHYIFVLGSLTFTVLEHMFVLG